MSWEQTDTDVWVAVIDNGVGLATGTDQAFDIGTTTKSKAAHYGMGLSIAREAARSLDGTVSLVPREEGGARFELRWPGLP